MKHLLLLGILAAFFSATAQKEVALTETQKLAIKLSKYTYVATVGNIKAYVNFSKNTTMRAWSNLYPDCISLSSWSPGSNNIYNISTTWISNTCGSRGSDMNIIFDNKSATPMFYFSSDPNIKYWAGPKIDK